ncbi:hypothetical protein [Parasutterella muris]|uniref:hypothetical protein n=1 Tax=Parasutterella muris TaxID=2565572 RepID=UPI00203BFDA7|nr:hypothetical protein [Parasutterella muris]
MARFSWAHYEALARREHLNSTEVSESIRRETGKRIHPEIVEQNLSCVVNNSFKEQPEVSVHWSRRQRIAMSQPFLNIE